MSNLPRDPSGATGGTPGEAPGEAPGDRSTDTPTTGAPDVRAAPATRAPAPATPAKSTARPAATKTPPTPTATPTPAAAGPAPTAPTATPPEPGHTPQSPFTLAIDIGGTGLKASVLDATGAMVADRVVVPTTYPCSPSKLVDDLVALVAPLPPADRVSAGFPGMVRSGVVLSAPHFVTEHGPGTTIDVRLVKQWAGFDLATALSTRLGKPTRVANDADVQGMAVVQGRGLELVVTLGTGVGTAFFYDGRLLPHLEFSHTPFLKGDTYNEQIGDAARKDVGNQRWNKRVRKAIATLRALAFFDHCYVGGGNAKKVHGSLGHDVSIVDNTAGILGGIKLWDESHLGV